ncbi:SOS response-associated peptidase [Thermoplasmatota archaeon]
MKDITSQWSIHSRVYFMCYNYNLLIYDNFQEFQNTFDATFIENTIPTELKDHYYVNSFSIPKLPVITNEDTKHFQMYYWGLIPFWVKKPVDADKIRIRTMNARSETLFDKPSFRHSIRNKRCLIPACGFFEWRYVLGRNYPYYIFLKDRKYFSFAGIWDNWHNNENDETVYTYSIITCDSNKLLSKIHNKKKRMPVILPRDIERGWLDNTLSEDEIKGYLKPYPDSEMKAHTISRLVTSNTENRNVARVIEPFNYSELKGME